MSLMQKIKTAVEAVGHEFLYDFDSNIERLIDLADFENDKIVVFAFILTDSQLIDGCERANIGLFFAKLTDFDADSFENDTLQEECKQAAWDFLVSVDSGNVLVYDTPTLQRFYDRFQANVTGVAVNANFQERSGLTDCFSV